MCHTLWLGVVPGEEGVVAKASEAISTWCLGLRGLQLLLDQLEIHNAWDHRLFLESHIPVALRKVLWFLLGLGLCLWTEGGWLKRGEWCFLWLTGPQDSSAYHGTQVPETEICLCGTPTL